MLATILDKIGDWNPQLYREIKGRFTPRNLMITIGCAIVTNYALIVIFCTSVFRGSEFRTIFQILNWLIPIVLITGCTYQLTYDLAKEYQKRTLNFLIVSPQSSQKILLGKILGVPSLIYLGIALILPLHFISGIASGVSFVTTISIYLLWLGCGFLIYNFALFGAISAADNPDINTKLSPENIAGLAASTSLVLVSVARSLIAFLAYRPYPQKWYWFTLPLGEMKILSYIWLVLIICAINYWMWNAINRRFYSKNKSLLPKAQVYQLVICTQILLIGFVFPRQYSANHFTFEILGLLFAFIVNNLLYLMILELLAPSRQYILDWTRYHHFERKNKNIYLDLIVAEKSPIFAAVCLISLGIILVWFVWSLFLSETLINSFLRHGNLSKLKIMIGLFLQCNAWLIYAGIAEIIFFQEKNTRTFGRGPIVFIIAIMSWLLIGFINLRFNLPWLWAFSLFPMTVYLKGSIVTACIGLLLQFVTLGLVTKKLVGTIKELGQSETKVLLADGRLS